MEAPAGGAACHQSDDPDADGHQAHAPGPLRLRASLCAVEVRFHPDVEVHAVEVPVEACALVSGFGKHNRLTQ